MEQRFVLALMGFWGIFCVYITRLNLSMAVVAMVGSEPPKSVSDQEEVCPGDNNAVI